MAHIAGYVHAAAAAASGGASDSRAPPAPPLFLCEGRATTALDASRRVAALATALTQRLGMQVGDRVCLAALATDHCLETLLAVTAAGGIAAPLNWRWGAAEAAGAAVLVGARLMAADSACLPFALALAAAAPAGTLTGLLLLGPPASFQEADLAAAQPLGLTPAFAEGLLGATLGASLALRSAPGNAALVMYTSGTTGKPKGVTLTHAALHSQSMAKLLMCGYSSADVYLHAAPLFHIGGISSALAMLAAGARHVFLPRFDGPALLAAIQQHSVTSFIAVPTMVADLLAAASSAGTPCLPSITRILVGGGGMSPALQHALAALCPAATVHAAYGMTEGASSLTFRTLWGPSGSSSSSSSSGLGTTLGPPGGVCVGRPPPGVELAIYTPLSGNGVGGSTGSSGGRIQLAGEGEVVTRGAHTMLGYWGDEDATSAAQLPGGWLRTGDLGCLRQGQLWLMGRAKDMIKSGGENVHAWEVERALGSHPAVALAAVVGAANWRLGEAVAAAVVLRPGWHWAGDRCQVLLARQRSGQYSGEGSTLGGSQTQAQNAQLALAAAADAVIPPVMRAAGLGGGGSIAGGAAVEEVVEEEQREERREASGAITYAEDLRSTLLQRSPSRGTGGSYGMHGAEDGLMAALEARPPSGRERHPSSALQQLAAVAAGLQYAAAAAAAATQCSSGRSYGGSGSSGDSSGSRQGADESQAVDGRALQQHCRAAGLAGFKLPRVFLMCDAAAASAAPLGSSRLVLSLNSTGKVVKHLLRETVQLHMGAAAGAPRSRL